MKANEFRIGNYYDQFGNIHQANGTIIRELEKSPESQIWCKPIPLTEEWMKRFGFKKEKSELFSLVILQIGSTKLKSIVVYLKGNHYNVSIVDQYTGEPIFQLLHLDYQYVHQLQNLYFALTGEDLKELSEPNK